MNTESLIKRTFIQASIAMAVVLFAWMLATNSKIILTGFGGILIAVLFSGSASWLGNKTNLPRKAWLPVTVIVPFILLLLFLSYTGPKIATQASELAERMPKAISYIQTYTAELKWIDQLTNNIKSLNSYDPKASTIMDAVSSFLSSTVNGLGSFIFALFLGLFLSVNPKWYVNGTVMLVPPANRERAREVFNECGSALSDWLVSKIASMIIVGVLTTMGLWMLGIDLALILGIIAALLSFIPNIGPLIAFIPAAMVSVISGFDALLYVTGLYVAVQTIESYVLTPVLQAKIAGLPPALTLFVQVILAGMVGMTGILLAAPLTVILLVIINMLYIEGLLESKTTKAK